MHLRSTRAPSTVIVVVTITGTGFIFSPKSQKVLFFSLEAPFVTEVSTLSRVMPQTESRINSITSMAYSFLNGFASSCHSVPCVHTHSPEEVELITGDGSSGDDVTPFDSVRLLSYNIFIRMSSLIPNIHRLLRTSSSQIHS